MTDFTSTPFTRQFKADCDELAASMVKKMEADLMATIAGPAGKPRQTALRARGNGFETVELDDAGNVIEPLRCTCGSYIVIHRPACPFYFCSVT